MFCRIPSFFRLQFDALIEEKDQFGYPGFIDVNITGLEPKLAGAGAMEVYSSSIDFRIWAVFLETSIFPYYQLVG